MKNNREINLVKESGYNMHVLHIDPEVFIQAELNKLWFTEERFLVVRNNKVCKELDYVIYHEYDNFTTIEFRYMLEHLKNNSYIEDFEIEDALDIETEKTLLIIKVFIKK